MEQERWAVVYPSTRQYVTRDGKSVAWTYDRKEADDLAGSDGLVVHVEEFVRDPEKFFRT